MKRKIFFRLTALFIVFSLLFLTSVSSFATSEINSAEIIDEVKNPVDNIVEIARAEIGFYESGNNKYTDWYYGRTTESSWCCIFVSWCAAQAGALDSAIPQRSSCESMRNWFKIRNRYYSIYDYYVPVKGDIVFYNIEVDGTDNIHHVEIITEDGYFLVDDTICVKSIGGNTSNLSYHGSQYVMEKFRPVDGPKAQVVGFCHPEYENVDRLIGKFFTFSDEIRTGDMRFIHSKYISIIYRLEEFWLDILSRLNVIKLF